MFESLLTAFALVLIIEGLMPLLGPDAWRRMFTKVLALHDGQIRFVGLASVVAGLALLAVAAW